jgi:tRNA 2-selenouridine synthase
MIQVIETIDLKALAGFDDVIDVRSPAEFAEDHAPGAVNLPVLSDEERAEVGTIYVQASRFEARRIGAAFVARNISAHLAGPLADRAPSWRPLVYCWRGGMRSAAMASILSQVGWRTALLKGGHRTWRAHVRARLYDHVWPLKLVLLDGGTGSGKTEILGLLAERGVQTLDLEGLACHRGSLLGALPGRPQPPQKLFESRLLQAREALDPSRPVVVEAESSKVGERMVPPGLWRVMQAAPRIELVAPIEERARYLARAYADIAQRPDLADLLERLPDRLGRKRLAEWRAMASCGAHEALAAELMEAHYDPAYRRSGKKLPHPTLGAVEIGKLDADGLARAAEEVADLVAQAG